MATIETRERRNGSVGYTARLRLQRDGVIVHEEAKTFDGRVYSRKDVERWALNREAALNASGALLGPHTHHWPETFVRSLQGNLW